MKPKGPLAGCSLAPSSSTRKRTGRPCRLTSVPGPRRARPSSASCCWPLLPLYPYPYPYPYLAVHCVAATAIASHLSARVLPNLLTHSSRHDNQTEPSSYLCATHHAMTRHGIDEIDSATTTTTIITPCWLSDDDDAAAGTPAWGPRRGLLQSLALFFFILREALRRQQGSTQTPDTQGIVKTLVGSAFILGKHVPSRYQETSLAFHPPSRQRCLSTMHRLCSCPTHGPTVCHRLSHST
ncbi:unnamed protein product [Periconia digitata]|uniref:Uncharacterized protein n=1 Tax=Periconia digitata TaxID=1303443 RepID=A0A9W4UUI4_9PLEO|nr:unnamed protein product [Periconia digitata]